MMLGLPTAALILLVLACLVPLPEGRSMTRRAWARLALLALIGLSPLPGCGRQSPAPGLPPDHPLLRKWVQLGKVWRDLMACNKEAEEGHAWSEPEFDTLTEEMEAALDALPAWPELRDVVEIQRERIYQRHYEDFPCYEMTTPGGNAFFADEQIEKLARELQRLAAEGTLSETAVRNAAEAIAVHAEYIARNEETQAMESLKAGFEAWQKLDDTYRKGELKASPAADLAGKRLVEMTLDDISHLAGPPQSNEGLANRDADEGQG
jgi:hypothetical protein